jgi:methylenetetrahydrofolate reductase (NADPH)
MTKPVIHPAWLRPAAELTDGYSLEITAKDIDSLKDVCQ